MQISIVGCGWLGLPLAKQLKKSGHDIIATCRSEKKRLILKKEGLKTCLFELDDVLESHNVALIFQSELLILNIPPGGRHIQAERYTQNMCDLIARAHQQGIQNIIFVSTSAVYGELQGAIIESTAVSPITPSAIAHCTIEQKVMENFKENSCVLRLAGLVGEKRHPAQYLAGKKDVAHGSQCVNLVHQLDVITAIEAIIEKRSFGHIFHLCAHEHPSRHDYYIWACETLGLALPEFVSEKRPSSGKLIDAQWTCDFLQLTLQYPSPFDMLE